MSDPDQRSRSGPPLVAPSSLPARLWSWAHTETPAPLGRKALTDGRSCPSFNTRGLGRVFRRLRLGRNEHVGCWRGRPMIVLGVENDRPEGASLLAPS